MDWTELADLTLVATTQALGQDVTYRPGGVGGVSVRGVFAKAHVAVSVGDGPESSSVAPTLAVRLADLPGAPASADRVVVGGFTYRVVDSQEDGEGGALLILKKV